MRIILRLFCIAICVVVVFIAVLPFIISTEWGTQQVLTLANPRLPGNVDLKKLSINWFGPQEFEDITFYHKDEPTTVSIKRLSTSTSLFQLLWNPHATDSVNIESLNASLSTGTNAPIITLKNLNVQLDKSVLKASGTTQQGSLNGQFTIDAFLKGMTFAELLQKHDSLEKILTDSQIFELRANADVTNFPLAILDEFIAMQSPELSGILQKGLGDIMNLKIQQTTTPEGVILDLNMNTKNLAAHGKALVNQSFTLSEPLDITLLVNPDAIDTAVKGLHIDSSWQLTSPTTIHIQLNRLIVPLKSLHQAFEKMDFTPIAITADINLQDASFISKAKDNTLVVQHLQTTLNTEAHSTVATANVNGEALYNGKSMRIQFTGTAPQLINWSSIINKKNLSMEGKITDIPLGLFSPTTPIIKDVIGNTANIAFTVEQREKELLATFQAKTEYLSTSEFVFKINDQLELIRPASITLTTTPAALKPFSSGTSFIQLNEPLNLTVSKFRIPIDDKKISQLHVNGSLNIEDLAFTTGNSIQYASAKLKDLRTNWSIDGETGLIIISYTGETLIEKQAAGKINGAITIDNWLYDNTISFAQTSAHFNTTAHKFPVDIISSLLNVPNLILIVGNVMDLTLESSISFYQQQPHANFNIKLNTPHIQGKASLTLDNDLHINVQQEATELRWTLTPKAYQVIQQWFSPGHTGPISLAQDSHVYFRVNSLRIPFSPNSPNSLSFLNAAIQADLSIDRFAGIDQAAQQSIVFNGINSQISSNNIEKQIAIKMSAKGQASNVSSSWDINATLENGFNNGKLNLNDLSLALDAYVENVSIPMLGALLFNPSLGQQLETVIGPTFNANVSSKLVAMHGPVMINLKGNNGQIYIDGQLRKGILTLNKDLQSQVTITPALGKYVLKEFIPIVDGILGSDQPLTLTISKDGFAVPLQNANILNISVGQAALALGKVRFSTQSQLAKVLSLLTPANTKELNVWLTPAYFSLNNGKVNLQRLDLLINNQYPIATWGNVDIGGDKVHMTIGLTKTAIEKAVGVSGMPKGYMLQLPLRGTLDNASIDKSKAAGRISALVAQNQGSPQGMVLGTVLNIATGGLNESKPPPPTTNPLPWAAMIEEAESKSSQQSTQNPSSSSSSQDQGKNKSTPDPIKELEKGATKALRKLFGG